MYKFRLSIIFLLIAFAFSTASANASSLLTGEDTILISKLEKEAKECLASDTVNNIISSDPASIHLNQKEFASYEILPVSNDPKKKKWVTAMFAFPFPFGFVAAHRVMLGSKPWIPIVYVATFGGCFGLLPLIDFCVILSSKDIEQYENNPNLFMWIK